MSENHSFKELHDNGEEKKKNLSVWLLQAASTSTCTLHLPEVYANADMVTSFLLEFSLRIVTDTSLSVSSCVIYALWF